MQLKFIFVKKFTMGNSKGNRLVYLVTFFALLISNIAVSAQGKLEFEKTTHDFGDIQIEDGSVKCQFNYTNVGDTPVVIHEIISSCGCTTPKWSKAPIKPGEKGSIEVVFKNDQGPYPFNKSITIYASEHKRPINLKIKGSAHERKKSISELYPLKIGGLGFKKSAFTAGYVDQGGKKTGEIDLANISSKKMEVTFSNLPNGLILSLSSNPINPKKSATLKYTIDTKLMNEEEWGNIDFKFNISGNGAKAGELKIEAFIKDDFNKLSKAQMKNAPLPYIKNGVYEYGKVKSGSDVNYSFTVQNKGKDPLIIRKIERSSESVEILSAVPLTINGGETKEIKGIINGIEGNGDTLYTITLITNSPSRPMINLFISGIVK